MFATRLLLCALTCVQAQVVVEKFAGVDRRSGDYAWEMGIHSPGTAWDPSGNAYLSAFHRVWKVRPDGIAEVIAGTGEGGVAGTEEGRYSGDGPATQAKFSFPDSPRRDAAGNIYFIANNRLLRIGTDGSLKTVAGNGLTLQEGMATEGRVENVAINPGKYLIDPQGVVYLLDNWLVRRVDTAGNITVVAAAKFCPYPCGTSVHHIIPPNTPMLNLIADLDVNPQNGDVYITEETDARTVVVHRLSGGGTLTRFRELPDTDLSFFDMAVDKDGNIFIARTAGAGVNIQKLDGTSAFPGTPQQGLFKSVLWLDADGRVVYVNGTTVRRAEDGTVVRTFPDGVMHTSPDGTPALEARVIGKAGYPTSLAVNRGGEVYFTEPNTCRVRKFDREKLLRTVFGLATCDAQFPALAGIALGPDDRLWVAAGQQAFVSDAGGTFSPVNLPPEMRGTLIAVDTQGRLYSAVSGRVARMDANGSVRLLRNDTFTNSGLGTDALGNVYYSDPEGVYRVGDDGSTTRVLSGGDYAISGKFVMDAQNGLSWGPEVPSTQKLNSAAIAPNGDIFGVVDPYVWEGDSLLGIYKRSQVAARTKPLISTAGIVNGASYAGNAVAPGELVTVFGDNFGLTGLQLSQVVNNRLPTRLGPVKVTFNDIEGAITAATPKQINVFVPPTIDPLSPVKIKVFVDESVSEEITLPVVETMFGLSTLDASGKGQGAILNANGTVNSRGNPAQKGSLIVLFGTGEGKVFPDAGIGAVNVAAPYPKATKPLFVRIGGQQAEIAFEGGAPTLAQGVYQINARIPLSVPSGDVTIEVVSEGGATSKPVTVAVQ